MRLVDTCRNGGCAAKLAPDVLESLLAGLPADLFAASRFLTRTDSHEDAAVVRLPANSSGKALVQTIDFFTPIVNDPYAFGQIAAANALSDVYAMGGEPWCAMNIVCFSIQDTPQETLSEILRGGADKLAEAETALAGGHSVNDSEIKYGLAVTGFVNANSFAANTNLKPGQKLMLTKALGTGILATAVKAEWEGHELFEELIITTAGKLNKGPGRVIRELSLTAATDITGFGLGGHMLEMATASNVQICLDASKIPVLPHVLELASMGLVPAGTHNNRRLRAPQSSIAEHVTPYIVDVVFDIQTSGGIVLALDETQIPAATAMLEASGDKAFLIGEVRAYQQGPYLTLS